MLNRAHSTLWFTLPAVQVSVSRESIAQSADGGAAWGAGQTADEIVQGLTAAIANNVRTSLRQWASLDSGTFGVRASCGESMTPRTGWPFAWWARHLRNCRVLRPRRQEP